MPNGLWQGWNGCNAKASSIRNEAVPWQSVLTWSFHRFSTPRTSSAALLPAIGSQVHYIPVHRQPYYRNLYGDLLLPGAEEYYAQCLSLPLYPTMSNEDVERVVSALSDAIGR